ncbi:MAG: PD-(D/E)XK nuclease family protein [Armatimonadetes bacterium]|nr:PD-(D/E)XK nuclease family protein [Armatimonadota bacterium]
MPRKPTISPSKMTTYLACPTKYMWTYIDSRGKWYLRSKSYYSFGTSLHSVLQRFHDSGDKGVTTTAEAVAALEESWVQAGYESQEQMMQALGEGKEIVEKYVEESLAAPVTAKTLFVEKMFRRDLGSFVLIGRVDRIDEREGGDIDIVDYKSGRSGVNEDDLRNDLAMSAYQLILQEHFPGRKIWATIIALRADSRASVSFSTEELEQFKQDMMALAIEILDRDWENHVPVAKSLCSKCDFLPLCNKHPEFHLDSE